MPIFALLQVQASYNIEKSSQASTTFFIVQVQTMCCYFLIYLTFIDKHTTSTQCEHCYMQNFCINLFFLILCSCAYPAVNSVMYLGQGNRAFTLLRHLYQAFYAGGYEWRRETIEQNGPNKLRASSFFNQSTHMEHKGRRHKCNSPPQLHSFCSHAKQPKLKISRQTGF